MRTLLYFFLALFIISSCAKDQIEKNLNNTWTLNALIVNGVNQVNASTPYYLNFHDIENGAGSMWLHQDGANSYYYVGDFQMNDDYTHLTADMASGGHSIQWDADFTVSNKSIELNGTWTDNILPNSVGFSANGE